MRLGEVAKVLHETVRAYHQLDSLMWHYGGILDDNPLDSLHEDWMDCYDVAYVHHIEWKEVVELVIFWELEDRVRLGLYETK